MADRFICPLNPATCAAYHTKHCHMTGECKYGAKCQSSFKALTREIVDSINNHCDTHIHIIEPRRNVIQYYKNKTKPYIPQGQRRAEAIVSDRFNEYEIPSVMAQAEKCSFVAPMPTFINGKWWLMQCASPPAIGWDMCNQCYNVHGSSTERKARENAKLNKKLSRSASSLPGPKVKTKSRAAPTHSVAPHAVTSQAVSHALPKPQIDSMTVDNLLGLTKNNDDSDVNSSDEVINDNKMFEKTMSPTAPTFVMFNPRG